MSVEWLSALNPAILTRGDEVYKCDEPVDTDFALYFGHEGYDGAVVQGSRDELLAMLDNARRRLLAAPAPEPAAMFTFADRTLCPTCTRRHVAFFCEQYGRNSEYVSLEGLLTLVEKITGSENTQDGETFPAPIQTFALCDDCGQTR